MNLQEAVKVLDHGHVKYIDHMGSDQRIIEAARQSTKRGFISWEEYWLCRDCRYVWTGKGKDISLYMPLRTPVDGAVLCTHGNFEHFPRGDMGLLETMLRESHTTPREVCVLIVEVKAPIMVFREWHRHRTQSYNEMSARYTQMPNEHYLPTPERIQRQSKTNKQGSGEAMDTDFANEVLDDLALQQGEIYETYQEWIEKGVAKEVARINTPVSRYSQMWATANLWNWLHFSNLRLRPAAQWEIRQYANAVGDIIKELFPRTWALFEEYTLYGVSFSRTELAALRKIIGHYQDPNTNNELMAADDTVRAIAQDVGMSAAAAKRFVDKLARGGKEIL